jgi:ribosomal protein S15
MQIKKQSLINKIKEMLVGFGKNTGCSSFQIANLTMEILTLSEHYSKNKKDIPVQRTIVRKVGERNRLKRYMEKYNPTEYKELIKVLELRR